MESGVESEAAGLPGCVAAVVARFGHPVLVEDAALRVVAANPPLVALWGVDPRAPDGHAVTAQLLFADPAEYTATVRRRIAERRPVVDERVRFADGRIAERDYLPLTVSGVPAGHLWVYRDVTGQVRTSDQRADEHQQLIELNQAKDRFLAAMSHELRTPLTSIISCTELMSSGGTGPLDPIQAELLAVIDRGATRLLGLISDLLLLAHLESGGDPLDLQPLDPADVVTYAVDAQRAGIAAEDQRLDVELAPGTRINADPDRLARVVKALLANAREVTPAGGRITVRAGVEGSAWTLRVTDPSSGPHAGPGSSGALGGTGGAVAALPPELVRDSSAIPASNLNLLLSRNIITHHGGTLTLRPRQEGTTVTVRLPLLPG